MNLQTTSKSNKDTHPEAKKVNYDAGYKNGINDYMKSTIEVFPDLDCSRLGVDVPSTNASVEMQTEKPRDIDFILAPAAEEVASKTPTP